MASLRTLKRLTSIERALPVGCHVCCEWSNTHVDRHGPDEPYTPPDRPSRCPNCGRDVSVVFIREYILVDDGTEITDHDPLDDDVFAAIDQEEVEL